MPAGNKCGQQKPLTGAEEVRISGQIQWKYYYFDAVMPAGNKCGQQKPLTGAVGVRITGAAVVRIKLNSQMMGFSKLWATSLIFLKFQVGRSTMTDTRPTTPGASRTTSTSTQALASSPHLQQVPKWLLVPNNHSHRIIFHIGKYTNNIISITLVIAHKNHILRKNTIFNQPAVHKDLMCRSVPLLCCCTVQTVRCLWLDRQ